MSQISVFTFDFGAGDERQDLERNGKEQISDMALLQKRLKVGFLVGELYIRAQWPSIGKCWKGKDEPGDSGHEKEAEPLLNLRCGANRSPRAFSEN